MPPACRRVSFCTYVLRGLLATYSKDEKAATAGAVADRDKDMTVTTRRYIGSLFERSSQHKKAARRLNTFLFLLISLNLVMLKCEAWILVSTARLVGAQRLVALAYEVMRVCSPE